MIKLYQYQKNAIAKLPASCIMHWDLGTGKTVSSLAHWQNQNTGRPLLIVAPAAKIRTGDWEQEARKWFGLALPDITYISYEKLRLNDKTTRAPRWWQYTGARNGGRVYDVIADECHALKNPQSKQSQAVNEIFKSGGIFIGLSGTPMANGWIDFAGYSKMFGFTRGITEYKTKYVRYQDYKGFPEIIGYNNIPELERQWAAISRYLSRADALELPDRQMIGQTLKLTPKSLKLYQTIKLTRIHPKTGEVYDNAPKLLNALRQSTTEPRLDALESILSDTSDNVVVFYNYISERKAILKLLDKMGGKTVIRYDGEQHDELPASDAELKNTVMLTHYKAGSTGLNLQWANTTIYFSPTYSYQEFEQSVGRTHRTGQTKKCLYYLFRVSGTVDVNIWQCLKNKQSFTNDLISKYLEEDD